MWVTHARLPLCPNDRWMDSDNKDLEDYFNEI
jgi:hypothetical protein